MYNRSEHYPPVSIVIVNYNGKDLLRQCLLTLLNTNYSNYEVIVVDNASTDGSSVEVKRSFGADSHITIIEKEENVGHAEGCNIGARISSGKYIVFLTAY